MGCCRFDSAEGIAGIAYAVAGRGPGVAAGASDDAA